jgi:glycosyltransferase involved in cell wall biosynthesis
MARPRICFVVSSMMTAEAFLANHIKALSAHYDVHLVANARPASLVHPDVRRATLIYARIEREISPVADVVALAQLFRILRRGGYSAIHSITPKAGLLSAIAAFAARIPIRIHTYTGQVWSTKRGAQRNLLKRLDKLISRLDTHLLVDSPAQCAFLRGEGVLGPGEGVVLANGSVSGVDPRRFRPDETARAAIRNELGVPADACVFVFVGRLVREKGILDLAAAFRLVGEETNDHYLILVGPDEQHMTDEIRSVCGPQAQRVRFAGYASHPERYMAAGDVFCMPSHREGCCTAILEAAAAGLPAIGSDVYGIVDTIDDGRTGILVPPRSPRDLAAAMRRLADDTPLRRAFAVAGRERAINKFSQHVLTSAYLEFYRALVRGAAPLAEQPV